MSTITQTFSDKEVWDLYTGIARYTLPRLKRFREIASGYPACLDSMEEWYEILDKIIFSFENTLLEEDHWEKFSEIYGKNFIDLSKSDKEKINQFAKRRQEGFELFGKYFEGLWD